jgi:carboxymethylenebutenolidase
MRITLPSGSPAEIARPTAREPSRGLVLWPDIMGLRPLFDELVARLSDEHGWVVCAPEIFPGQESLPLDERFGEVPKVDQDARLADAVAAADACGVEPVAVLGFCMGGMYAFKCAATGRFDRAVGFYGMVRLPDDWAGPRQTDAIDFVTRPGAAPVMGIFGTEDPYCPADHVDELRAAGAEVVTYEGAHHGFVHDPSRPTHRGDDAADAWRRVTAFLA